MPIENRPCMAIVLGTDLVLAKELRWPMQEFTVENKTYEDAGFGNWTAFYDWLRSSDSSLLGVRYWLRDDLHFLGDSVKNKDYAEVEAGRQIEIYFSGRREGGSKSLLRSRVPIRRRVLFVRRNVCNRLRNGRPDRSRHRPSDERGSQMG
jgi:hypothetical protein